MIVVTMVYPTPSQSDFDYEYYVSTHVPMVARLLEPAGLRSSNFARTVTGSRPAEYALVAQLRFDDAATMKAALKAHGAALQADMANFTTAPPIQIVGESDS